MDMDVGADVVWEYCCMSLLLLLEDNVKEKILGGEIFSFIHGDACE